MIKLGVMTMDEVINKIINIDKETERIRIMTGEVIRAKEKELKETIQELEKRYMEEGRLEGEKIYNRIIEDGEVEVEKLKLQDTETLNAIDDVYKKNKYKLVDDLWSSLFKE